MSLPPTDLARKKRTMILEVRAQLTSMRGVETLSRRAFLIRKAATAPDARGGAMAARAAAGA